jgi:propionyl-CoA carboxylase beta chain
MHEVGGIIDEDSFFEVHKNYAENILVGFAQIGRKSGGCTNQPMILAGCLDVNSSKKAARFTFFCDCFNIPLLVWWMYQVFTGNGSRMERDYRSRCETLCFK